MVGIPVPIDASAINRRLSAMENSIKSLQGARSLSAATISNGGLTIRDGGGLTVRDGGEIRVRYRENDGAGDAFYVGDQFAIADGAYQGTGVLVQRPDGGDIFAAYANPVTGAQVLAGRDPQGDIVLGTAPTRGLYAPSFAPHMASMDYTTWGGIDGSAWGSVMEGAARLWSPRIRAQCLATADTPGATGSARLMLSYAGTDYQIGSTLAIGFGIAAPLWEGEVPAAIPIGGYFLIKLQTQRTAGTGKIRGAVTHLLLGP